MSLFPLSHISLDSKNPLLVVRYPGTVHSVLSFPVWCLLCCVEVAVSCCGHQNCIYSSCCCVWHPGRPFCRDCPPSLTSLSSPELLSDSSATVRLPCSFTVAWGGESQGRQPESRISGSLSRCLDQSGWARLCRNNKRPSQIPMESSKVEVDFLWNVCGGVSRRSTSSFCSSDLLLS